MPAIATKKLNLPLPRRVHEALFVESRELGVPATRLVRSLLEDWLQERMRVRRRAEVRRFAMEHAGTELDLDPELEAAATAELQRLDEEEDEAR